MKCAPTKQTPNGGGKSAPNGHAVGSGAKVMAGKHITKSSAPTNIRHRKG